MRVAKSTITKKVNRLVDYDDDSEDEAPGQEQRASEQQQHQPQQGKGTEAAFWFWGGSDNGIERLILFYKWILPPLYLEGVMAVTRSFMMRWKPP